MNKQIRVTIWNEYRHERSKPAVQAIYPQGIHQAIADRVDQEPDLTARTAVLDEPEHGLSESVLAETDVLIWWGHAYHGLVDDAIVTRVHDRVLAGMGLIVLHSGHGSKIFCKLMGTHAHQLKWREIGEKERLWVIEPGHPIADGLPEYFEMEHEEMYGERFDIPTPDALILISWFAGGEVFRSGCCFQRGRGKIFYFRPGHETFPVYHQPVVQKILLNAIRWAAPAVAAQTVTGRVDPLEKHG
jgi:trehalose utilization protein